MTGRLTTWALRLLRALALGLLLLAPAFAWAASPELPTDRLIVKLRGQADDRQHRPVTNELRHSLSTHAGELLEHHRTMSGGAHVLRLSKGKSLKDVEAIAAKLRTHPDVLYAVPDRIVFPQLTPNDPQFSNQWYLQPAASGGINAPAAWDITTGSASIVVAVIDTGILPHADLAGRTVPGYDFISDPNRSNDGNGRDADPTDPGDWVTAQEAASGPLAGCPVQDSSWHGTRLAGIIGASGNNAIGIAGLNWVSKILPVRAIGKCGGFTSDIVDAMRWAAGITVSGVPDNANPAKVINLSLATAGACDAAYQSAINDVTTAGAVVVAAAGNQGQNAANFTPASCTNLITVGAVDRNGGLTSYSNVGASVSISAFGGTSDVGIISTSDSGTQSPLNDNAYLTTQGTSLAAAQVAGIVSLVFSQSPGLTPAQVRDFVRNTGQPFPADAISAGSFANCTAVLCGRGIPDAMNALRVSSSLSRTPQIAAAREGILGLRNDGTVWAWGATQLGSWPRFPAPMPSLGAIRQVSLGANFCCGAFGFGLALRQGGTVWAWGFNNNGQLGDGTTTNR